MEIFLGHKEILDKINQTVKQMSSIRKHTLLTNKIPPEYQYYYELETMRLAGFMKEAAHKDKTLREKMLEIASYKNNFPDLWHYDPLQDIKYSDAALRNDPAQEFATQLIANLDYILFYLLEKNVTSMDEKHNLYQAIKYLDIKKGDYVFLRRTMNSIKPVCSAPSTDFNDLIDYLLIGVRSGQYGIFLNERTAVCKITTHVDHHSRIQSLQKHAVKKGAAFLELIMSSKIYAENQKEFENGTVASTCPGYVTVMFPLYSPVSFDFDSFIRVVQNNDPAHISRSMQQQNRRQLIRTEYSLKMLKERGELEAYGRESKIRELYQKLNSLIIRKNEAKEALLLKSDDNHSITGCLLSPFLVPAADESLDRNLPQAYIYNSSFANYVIFIFGNAQTISRKEFIKFISETEITPSQKTFDRIIEEALKDLKPVYARFIGGNRSEFIDISFPTR